MVIKLSTYLLSIYVNNGLRHCEIGKALFKKMDKKIKLCSR